MTLYLKYRPQIIDELDLESVRSSLKKIVASKNLPHAFLFSGPKGTGKTSSARILAKVVNCENLSKDNEPCNKCSQCLAINNSNHIDVIEMDAASNRGIDDIRALRESVLLSPSMGKKKIYIIDEAHMLTTEASNAFLKTLEEPPAHVVFILATTDPQKLPDTVRSRLTDVSFQKATNEEIYRQLGRVASGEKIKVSDELLNLIAENADGSFRDAVKILETLILEEKLDFLEAEKIINKKSNNVFSKLVDLINQSQKNEALEEIKNLVNTGNSASDICDYLIISSQQSLLFRNKIKNYKKDFFENISSQKLVEFIDLLIFSKNQIPNSPIDEIPLEVAILKFIEVENDEEEKKPLEKKVEQKEKSEVSKSIEQKLNQMTAKNKSPKEEKEIVFEKEENSSLDNGSWKKICEGVREKSTTMDTILRSATPISFDGENLKLGLYYRFHKERLETIQSKSMVEEIASQVFGKNIRLECEIIQKNGHVHTIKTTMTKNEQELTNTTDNNIIDAAKEIFG